MPKPSNLNPILEKVKSAVNTKLPEELKDAANRILVAGMKLLYTEETHQKMVLPVYQLLKQQGFSPNAIANGMVHLLVTLFKASKGGMQVEAAYPAGIMLMTYVLDDLEKTQGLQVTEALVKDVGTLMVQKFVKAFGLKNADEKASSEAEPAEAGVPAEEPATQPGILQQPAQGAV